MQYGVCTAPDNAGIFRAAGFSFIEVNIQQHLLPLGEIDEVRASLDAIQNAGLPAVAANCLMPGRLPVTGPDVDGGRIQAYIDSAFEHAQQVGIHTLVFGSGGARKVPDLFERGRAWRQLVAFCARMAPVAERRDIVVVVEPLNSRECNILNTVTECAQLVRDVGHPNIQLLVDGYHFASEEEDLMSLDDCASLVRHVHVATHESRLPPGAEPCDFAPLLRRLSALGYAGRVSIEARWNADTLAGDASRALEVLREAANGFSG